MVVEKRPRIVRSVVNERFVRDDAGRDHRFSSSEIVAVVELVMKRFAVR